MTLESGLDALSDLKEMKDLKVGCMDHRIGDVDRVDEIALAQTSVAT